MLTYSVGLYTDQALRGALHGLWKVICDDYKRHIPENVMPTLLFLLYVLTTADPRVVLLNPVVIQALRVYSDASWEDMATLGGESGIMGGGAGGLMYDLEDIPSEQREELLSRWQYARGRGGVDAERLTQPDVVDYSSSSFSSSSFAMLRGWQRTTPQESWNSLRPRKTRSCVVRCLLLFVHYWR